MRCLLDTHVWLWMLTAPDRVRGRAADVLRDARSELLLSAASSWEIAIKYAIGRLPLPESPETYVPERMRLTRVESLPVTHAHALRVAALPRHHQDPFDRLLIAQAQIESLTIVTVDPAFGGYDVRVLAAA
jgi:PIN domain nuclease of toxin-antitoxin system